MSSHDHAATTPGHPSYVRIYLVLLALLGVSLLGPTLEIPLVTLITAFGIAVVKATMVAAYFMHLNIEERYVWYILLLMLGFMLVMFAGIAPDVMLPAGQNWLHLPIEPPAPPAHP
ncbi:MAG: cytochrome C oxidase subunit IV family protein [Deltaproteobacteria bacterium]|nr:cytochrome C oxidase subunit IV family protein [Deltaproteobacteria bacterium]